MSMLGAPMFAPRRDNDRRRSPPPRPHYGRSSTSSGSAFLTLSRRSRRTVRRGFTLALLVVIIFLLFDSQRPDTQRMMRQDIIQKTIERSRGAALAGYDYSKNGMQAYTDRVGYGFGVGGPAGIGQGATVGKGRYADGLTGRALRKGGQQQPVGGYANGRQHVRPDPRGWPGWAGIEQIYSFGDSHTYTGFNPRGAQPDDWNPIGNPAWPGKTFNHGPNFVGHLTATFNLSFIRTYNFAVQGSPFEPSPAPQAPMSLIQQVEKKFLPKYGKTTLYSHYLTEGEGKWSQRESLFVIWHGVDDILFTFKIRGGGRNDTTIQMHIDHYRQTVEKLYKNGARNFIFAQYPELEKSPFMRNSDIAGNFMDIGAEIVQYNARLAFMAHCFAEAHSDVNVFVFDTHKYSLAIREEPLQFPETTQIVKLEGFCYPYADDVYYVDTKDVYNELCGVALDGWYWKDEMHFTEPFHKLIARKMVEHMADPLQRLPMEFY